MKFFLLLCSLLLSPISVFAYTLNCSIASDPNQFVVDFEGGGGSVYKLIVTRKGKQDAFDVKKAVFDAIFTEGYKVISMVIDTAGVKSGDGSFFHLVALPETVQVSNAVEGFPIVKFSAKVSYDGQAGIYLDGEDLSCTLEDSPI